MTLKALKPCMFPVQPQTLGEHIKARPLALRLTQPELAARLGVSPFTVLNCEKGKTQPARGVMSAVVRFLEP